MLPLLLAVRRQPRNSRGSLCAQTGRHEGRERRSGGVGHCSRLGDGAVSLGLLPGAK